MSKNPHVVCTVCGDTEFVDEVTIVNGKCIITPCPRGCHKFIENLTRYECGGPLVLGGDPKMYESSDGAQSC